MAKKAQDHTKRLPASPELVNRVKAIQAEVQNAHAQIEQMGTNRVNELASLSKAEAKIPDAFLYDLDTHGWVMKNGKPNA